MKKQIENLQKSFELSSQKVIDAVNPLEIAALFEKKKITYVLIGGHMVSFYTGMPRATVDVDVIVPAADFSRAVDIIEQNYASLVKHDRVQHLTFDSMDTSLVEKERIDLVRDNFEMFREIIKTYSYDVRFESVVIRIPKLEAAIALKFAAAISPNRGDQNKPVDYADFLNLIRSNVHTNDEALGLLGEMAYSGGGSELVKAVMDVRRGKPIVL